MRPQNHKKLTLETFLDKVISGDIEVGRQVRTRIEAGKYESAAKWAEDLLGSWHSLANQGLDVGDILVNSGRKVWWRHEGEDGVDHEWQASVAHRVQGGQSCAVCAGKQIQLGVNDLASQRPDIAAEWDYKANRDAQGEDPTHPGSPEEVTVGSTKKVFWLSQGRTTACAGHRWEAAVYKRSQGYGCSVCRGFTVQLGVNDLASQMPKLAAEWDWEANAAAYEKEPNHPRSPEEVTVSSNKKVFWLSCNSTTACEDHSWQATVGGRTAGAGCAVCNGAKIQLGVNDLASQRPDLVEEWHWEENAIARGENNKHPVTPEEVTVFSHRRVWWKCQTKGCGRSWKTPVNSRTSRGSGCPTCSRRQV